MSPRLKQEAVGHHIRQLRAGRGMSGRDLAAQTDFSPSFISQVEHGLASPSIGSMEKIAEALGVTLGEFFAAAVEGEGGLVVRAGDRRAMTSGWSSAEIEALSPMSSLRRLEPVLVTLRPHGRSGKHPYPHSQEEFAFVLEGEVTLTLGPETHALRRGDAVTILPRELRLWENRGSRRTSILLISSRPGATAGGPTKPQPRGGRPRAPR